MLKKIGIFLLTFAFFIMNTASGLSPVKLFDDVSSSSEFYYDGIALLKDEGIVEGYSDGTYRPKETINRAEMLKILIEAKYLGQNTEFLNSYTDKDCFDDVEADKWYTGYVCYAKEKNWIDGYADGSFKPGDDINFVEAVKILMNVLDLKMMHDGNFSENDPWYRNYVESAAVYNFIPMTIKNFGQMINRGEMADMIARKVKYDAGELSDYLGDREDYKVDYAGIKKGVNQYEKWKADNETEPVLQESDPAEGLGLAIKSITADLDSIYIGLEYSLDLQDDEIFHIECLENGKAKSFAKTLDTYLEEVQVKNLKKGTLYNCWAAVKNDGGDLSWETDTYPVTTLSAAEKVVIIESSAIPTEITLRVKSMNLQSGEKYFAECIGPGGSNDFYPEASSTSTTLVVKKGVSSNVKVLPDSNYSCYVAVTGVDGMNRYFSDKVNVYTPEPPLVVSQFTVGSDSVDFSIDEVPLGANQYFFAECYKDGIAGPWGNPHQKSTTRYFSIDGLKNNTEYECTVEIRGVEDPDYEESKVLGFKTKSDGAQILLTIIYGGIEKDGNVYVALGTNENTSKSSSEKFYYFCQRNNDENDVSEDPITMSSDETEAILYVSSPGSIYRCGMSVMDNDSIDRQSEMIWVYVPDVDF